MNKVDQKLTPLPGNDNNILKSISDFNIIKCKYVFILFYFYSLIVFEHMISLYFLGLRIEEHHESSMNHSTN